jgi:ribonuclease HII
MINSPKLETCFLKGVREAGCDEAGRGCLAGPVYAAAVVLPPGFSHPLLNDSKKLSRQKRDLLRILIEKESEWAIGFCTAEEIDGYNILKASIFAMHKALVKLSPEPAHILVDGNRFIQFKKVPYKTMIRGDGRFMNIAAASILAKTHRDEYMSTLHNRFPEYNWKQNKGYPTKEHRTAIEEIGACPYHRKSFTLLPAQQRMF